MIKDLSKEKILLQRRIAHKKQLMETKKNDFNYYDLEARRLERIVHNLWNEILSDQSKLANLEIKQLNYSE
ncbi:MAG TPA: hypothetical protein VN726_22965 [Hanamia sp.]|nr:hypothetical protein [Hanamia sp.]